MKRLSDYNMNWQTHNNNNNNTDHNDAAVTTTTTAAITESATILEQCRKLSRSSDPVDPESIGEVGFALCRVRKTSVRYT